MTECTELQEVDGFGPGMFMQEEDKGECPWQEEQGHPSLNLSFK